MARVRGLIGAAALALILSPVAAPAQTGSITKTEIRRDPPAVTDRRLKDLLWSMLRHRDLRLPKPPQRALDTLDFRTAAVMTTIPLLCRSDVVFINFAPTAPGPADADSPTRPVGVEVNHLFRYLVLPDVAAREDRVPVHIGGRCGQLDVEHDEEFFKAPDEFAARDGMIAFLKLQRAVHEKRQIRLSCDTGIKAGASCAELIGGLRPEQIGSVERCDPSPAARCFAVWIDDRDIRVFVATAGAHEGEIESAALTSYITVSDPRID